MTDGKRATTVTLDDLVERLDGALAEIQSASTPARVLRVLAPSLKRATGARAVSAFAFGPTGSTDLVDESLLPAANRGATRYPEAVAESATDPWSDLDSVTALAQALDEPFRVHAMATHDEVLGGIVTFGAPEHGPEGSAAAVRILLREAALALRNLKLGQAVKSSLAEGVALQRITQAITRSLDFDRVVDTLLVHTKRLFRVDAVALFLAEPEAEGFYINKADGLSDEYVREIRIRLDNPAVQKLIAERGPAQLVDASKMSISTRPDLVAKEGIVSLLMAPITSGADLVGALVLYSRTPRHFIFSELRFSQSLAEQASIAFANANLHTGLVKVSNEIEQTRNLMQDGLLVLDTDRALRYFNAAASEVLGLTPDTTGQRFGLELLGPDLGVAFGASELESAIGRALEGTVTRSDFATGDALRPARYEAVYSPYRDTTGEVIGVLVSIRDITQLYREKEKLLTIQRNMQDGLVMIDPDGVVMERNDEWSSVFGAEPEATDVFAWLGGRDDIVFDRDVAAMARDVLQGKRLTSYGHFTEGSGRHVQISLGPIESGGIVSGAVATVRDITPLIEKTLESNAMAAKAQRHLRELSQLAELSSIVGFNVSGIFARYLQKTATLLGSPAVAIYQFEPERQMLSLRQATEAADVPEDLPVDDEHLVAASFTGRRGIADGVTGRFRLAAPIIHHSKTLGVILVEREGEPYGEHDAKLLRVVSTRLAVLIENSNLYHDVNARRERWEAVFRFTEDGIVIFDRDGKIVGFNPASTDISEWEAQDAIGRPFDEVIKSVTTDQNSAGGPSPLATVLGEGITIAKTEQLLENRSGGRLWTEVSYSPIFDDAGRITSGIAIIRNTQKDREIEEIKSDFISIVSHELRTPLTAIKGFLSMILKQDFGALADKQAHYLGRVYQSNQRMIDLVEDLLDVSYIESGKINLTIAPVAIDAVVSDVVAELQTKAETGQIAIRVKKPKKKLPLVLADESRLHQIMLNLVDNAIKYSMPETTVDIDCTIQDDELITTITDRGVGISKSQIDRLFTKFGRIYNPMSVQAGGSGLGLYIVKNLIESHGGRIWVTSQEGKGSKFRFSVPVAKQLPLLDK